MTFERIWCELSSLARDSQSLATVRGSEYRLALSHGGLVLKSKGRTSRSYSRDAIRRLWELRGDLGAPVDVRPLDIQRLYGTGRHGSYLWAIYAEMWRLENTTKRGKTARDFAAR